MAVNARAVSVATTATAIDLDEGTGSGPSGQGASLYNNGSATVYLGGPSVTTAEGYPLGVGEHLALDLERVDRLFGIVATGTVEVRVLEVGV